MSKTDASEAPPEKAKAYLCGDGVIGCGHGYDKRSFRFKDFFRVSCLCDRCEAKIGNKYGVEIADASAVGAALFNMSFYFSMMEGAEDVLERGKVRTLLLAAGVKILNPVKEEIEIAKMLKENFTDLGKEFFTAPKLKTVPDISPDERQLNRGDRL